MPTKAPPAPARDVLEVDWPFFGELCRALALRIVGAYDPEIVLGIAKAGGVRGVDETCDSGDTLKLALSAVRKVGPADVRTAVSFKTGPYAPDFYALATDSFIILPWDREIIVDGEFVMRPEYAAKLRELAPRQMD